MIQAVDLRETIRQALDCVVISPSPSQIRLCEKLSQLQERLLSERFQLAVLGQFKRGKSTLLNALLGMNVLPTAVIPQTAIPTFLEAGTSLCLHMTFQDGRKEVADDIALATLREHLKCYVTEEANPTNRLQVERVQVLLPSPLLNQGVVLIDTPGVGSTFQHNTATAEAILPECDAALFVVSPDPPITEVEVAYLSQIRPHVAHLIVVLNKIDALEPDERMTSEAFLQWVLQENKLEAIPVFSLSARNASRAIERDDQETLLKSGLPELEAYLVNFLANDKQATLTNALTHKAANLIAQLRLESELSLRALSMPLADLEERIKRFDEFIGQFTAEHRMAQDLLQGDKKRLMAELEDEAERMRDKAKSHFEAQVNDFIQQGANPDAIRAALAAAVPDYFKAQLDCFATSFQSKLSSVLSVHQQRTENLIAQVRQVAADLMEIPNQVPDSTDAFNQKQKPYWVLSGQITSPNIIQPDSLDRFLPPSIRKARLHARLLQEVETLILHNVENLRWATRQNIDTAFRHFSYDLDEAIQTSLEATQGAMVAALERREHHSDKICMEIKDRSVALECLKSIEVQMAIKK